MIDPQHFSDNEQRVFAVSRGLNAVASHRRDDDEEDEEDDDDDDAAEIA